MHERCSPLRGPGRGSARRGMGPDRAGAAAAPPEPALPLGALAPANLTKPRPTPPFDLTGTWLNDLRFPGSWRFGPPPPGVKLTPEAQMHFDAARKAQAEGKVYRDDIGQCWPAGLPMIMTRVWPIAMVQLPTVIYMVSGFMNSLRIIYLDAPSFRSRHRRAQLQRRVDRPLGEGHAGGGYEVLRGAPPLDRLRHPGERRPAHRRADPDGRTTAARSRSNTPRRSQGLGRRVEVHQAVEPRGRSGHRRKCSACLI